MTRIKVIFKYTNVFVNLVKLMQIVQDERKKRENYILSIMKTYIFIWIMSLHTHTHTHTHIYISRGSGYFI
jgi:hypothetical protein